MFLAALQLVIEDKCSSL